MSHLKNADSYVVMGPEKFKLTYNKKTLPGLDAIKREFIGLLERFFSERSELGPSVNNDIYEGVWVKLSPDNPNELEITYSRWLFRSKYEWKAFHVFATNALFY